MPGLTFACFLLGAVVPPIDYCATSYCPQWATNIGCNPPAMFGGGNCPTYTSPKVVTITPALRSHILDEHNTRRSDLALGNINSFPAATRMATLQWDAELASQAGNNARSCIYMNDACRNTPQFGYAGQNIAMKQFSGTSYTTAELIDEFITSWWDEKAGTNVDYINIYPSIYSGPEIGHFTQMASDRSWKIGCAMQSWIDGLLTTYYFVCNYSFTNVVGQPVYVIGTTAAACTTGSNPSYHGLCSTAEMIQSVP